jgi:hypothetical protein
MVTYQPRPRNLPESVDSAVSVPSYMSNDDDDDSLSDIEVRFRPEQ